MVSSLFPCWQERVQGLPLEEPPNLSSTLAQGENAEGPQSNHRFTLLAVEVAVIQLREENPGLFFSHLNVSVIQLLKKSTAKDIFHLPDGRVSDNTIIISCTFPLPLNRRCSIF